MDNFDWLGDSTSNAPATNDANTEVKTEPAPTNDLTSDDPFGDFGAPVQNQAPSSVDTSLADTQDQWNENSNTQNDPYGGDLNEDAFQTAVVYTPEQQLFDTNTSADTQQQNTSLFDDDSQQLFNTDVPAESNASTSEKQEQQQDWTPQNEEKPAADDDWSPQEQPSTAQQSNENLTPAQKLQRDFEQRVAAKDAEETRRKDELRQQAKADLERWYNERKRQMENKRETMKTDEETLRSKALEKSQKDNCDWAKVIRFLDFSSGTQLSKSKRDLTRMKTTIINAKRYADNQNSSSTSSSNGV